MGALIPVAPTLHLVRSPICHEPWLFRSGKSGEAGFLASGGQVMVVLFLDSPDGPEWSGGSNR